jgi:hypothetical protein
MVHENIIPGIAPDESVAFFIIKPFNHALFFHFSSLFFTSNPALRAGIQFKSKLSVFVPSKPKGGRNQTGETSPPQTLKTFQM